MRKYLLLLFTFLASACVSLSGTSAPPLSITHTSDPSIGNFPTITSLPEALLSDLDLVAPHYIVSSLSCENYVETTWGNGAGQWGPSVDSSGELQRRFFPPVFNSNGELYILDSENHRLLKYDGITINPVQVISIPDYYFTFPASLAVTIAKDRIIIPYGVNMIGIMSLDGQVVKDVQLPNDYSYNMLAPGWFLAWVDERGGLLVKSDKGIYFDVGWADGKWNKISEGNFAIRPFSWQGYIGDMNSVQPKIQIYKIDSSTNFLAEPANQFDTGLSAGFNFIGGDNKGRVYIEVFSDGTQVFYARYSILDGAKQIGIVEGDLLGQIIQSGVASDGTIYMITYHREDMNMGPRIVKCNFSDN